MPTIEILSALPEAEVEAKKIDALLGEHGWEKGYVWDEEALTVRLKEEGGETAGGLIGRTVQGWLYIAGLAVAQPWRGQCFGNKLVAEAERIAVERGCHGSWLNTHSFQAPGFYEKLGYRRFGVLDDFPIGEQRIFYMKRLEPTGAGA